MSIPASANESRVAARLWVAGAVVAFLWFALYLTAMNWQIVALLRLCGVTQLLGVAGMTLFVLYTPRRPHHSPVALLSFGVLLLTLLWGITDIFYWDGIQTAGRSQLFVMGRSEDLPRLSLTYVFLGTAFRLFGNHNWVGHLYIILWAAALLWLMTLAFRGSRYRLLAVLVTFLSPYVLVLSKWLYLDIPSITAAFATILAHDWAARRPSARRFAVALACLTAACLLKESGVILLLPLLIMPLLCPRANRRKVALWTILNCAIGVTSFVLLAWFYRSQLHDDSGQVNWLLFNSRYAPALTTGLWFLWAMVQHLRSAVCWSLLLFAVMGLVAPQGRRGRMMLGILLLIQVLLVASVKNFAIKYYFIYRPLDPVARHHLDQVLLALAFFCLVAGFAVKALRWRRPRRMEALCWLMLLATAIIFSATGKSYPEGPNHSPWIALDWRYLGLAIPPLLLLTVKGSSRLLAPGNPAWFRAFAAVALALSIQMAGMRAAMMVAFYSQKARLYQTAFNVIEKRPERTVFTHWPFFMGCAPMDYGSLTWKSGGFTLRNLKDCVDLSKKPLAQRPPDSLLLHDDDLLNSLRVRDLYREPVFMEKAQMRYLSPLAPRVKREKLNSLYVARVGPSGGTPKAMPGPDKRPGPGQNPN